MTEEEILTQLRDIHYPAEVAGDASLVFAIWPFLVLGGMVALLVALRLIGRNRWRRVARAELAEIATVEDPGRQWAMLLSFATSLSDRAGRSFALPETAFRRPDAIGDAERVAFIAHIRAELGR